MYIYIYIYIYDLPPVAEFLKDLGWTHEFSKINVAYIVLDLSMFVCVPLRPRIRNARGENNESHDALPQIKTTCYD